MRQLDVTTCVKFHEWARDRGGLGFRMIDLPTDIRVYVDGAALKKMLRGIADAGFDVRVDKSGRYPRYYVLSVGEHLRGGSRDDE